MPVFRLVAMVLPTSPARVYHSEICSSWRGVRPKRRELTPMFTPALAGRFAASLAFWSRICASFGPGLRMSSRSSQFCHADSTLSIPFTKGPSSANIEARTPPTASRRGAIFSMVDEIVPVNSSIVLKSSRSVSVSRELQVYRRSCHLREAVEGNASTSDQNWAILPWPSGESTQFFHFVVTRSIQSRKPWPDAPSVAEENIPTSAEPASPSERLRRDAASQAVSSQPEIFFCPSS